MPFPRPRRRTVLKAAAGALSARLATAQSRPPNIVMIYADDLGYGDLGCYGSKIATPNLDRMSGEGMLFTHFYSANPICSPARAALLTGRYPTRTGVATLLVPNDTKGLGDTETTLAQSLKSAGYRTMCVGKWHLGNLPQFMPTNRGFDEFYGVPYSVDMSPLPLMHNLDTLEQPATLETLTQRYTQQAVDFIGRSKDAPFFLYMPHSFPHIPIAVSDRFRGSSPFGPYGDAVQEIDWSVGEVLTALKDNGLDENTLVMFSSDHGPWYQGSTGPFRGRKGTNYEGGVRVPLVARWPGLVPSGAVCPGVASAMDIFATVARLCGAPPPSKPLDGIDIWPMLSGQTPGLNRDALLFFSAYDLQCARLGRWKLHVSRYNTDYFAPAPPGGMLNLPLGAPELYDVVGDPEESYNLADRNPDVVADIRKRMETLLPTFSEYVNFVWRCTMGTPVAQTPEGAYPVCRP